MKLDTNSQTRASASGDDVQALQRFMVQALGPTTSFETYCARPSSARTRSSVGGCVENSFNMPPPLNGFMMNM